MRSSLLLRRDVAERNEDAMAFGDREVAVTGD